MTTMRLLPALALAAGVALAFKISGLASAPWEAAFDAHAAAEPAKPVEGAAEAHAGTGHPPEAPPSSVAAGTEPPVQIAANAAAPGDAASQGEADVLRSLAARREALNARERDIAVREQTLAVAEKRVEERVAELKAIEARINAALGQRETAHQEQIQALVKMYESMKPADAAKIFEKMANDILIAVTSNMKPVKLGAVLALMDPGKAQDLTVLLANRLNPDQILGSKPAAAPAPAAAPTPPPAAQPAAAAPPPALQPDVLPKPSAALTPSAAPSPAPAAILPPDTLPVAPAAPPAAPVAARPAAAVSSAVPQTAPPPPTAPGKS